MVHITEVKTTKFSIIAGINKGYFHKNSVDISIEDMSAILMTVADNLYKSTGIYVSAVVTHSRTLYSIDYGCPPEGEDTFSITGTANPKYVTDIKKWKEVVISYAESIKSILEQEVISLEFCEVNYLTL